MAKLIVIVVDLSLIDDTTEKNIKNISKFYERFKNNILSIIVNTPNNFNILQEQISLIKMYNVRDNLSVHVESSYLNHFARNRLINNFEEDRPELTLTLMGCDENTSLLKIWKSDVKRKIRH